MPNPVSTVSVIIPAYNAEETLSSTLASVCAQTYGDLEIFVVDDGSQDKTLDLAKDFASQDHRLRVLSKTNGGVASARNAALELAKGPYVTWIDADDLWHRDKISRQLSVFKDSPEPLSIVYTGYRLIDAGDRIIENFRPLTDVSGHTVCRQIATNFFSNTSSIMIPLPLVRQLGGHEPRLRKWGIEGAEDLLLQLQLSLLGPVGCCREALVGYRMHAANMSLGHARASRSNLKALELVEQQAPDIPDWVFRIGRARVVGYAAHMLRNGKITDALSLTTLLMRGQPIETAKMMSMILASALKNMALPNHARDPETGQLFADSDPRSAPWGGHMILGKRTKTRLEAADLRTAPAIAKRGGPIEC